MNYERFARRVIDRLPSALPEGYADCEVERIKMPVVNGIRDCLHLHHPEKAEAIPVIYLDEMYQDYRNGVSFPKIIEEMSNMFAKGIQYQKQGAYENEFLNPEQVIFGLINTEKNQEYLQDIPHRDFLDLSIIYRIYISHDDGTFSMATVNNGMMKEMGLSEEELHQHAWKNTRQILPVEIEHIGAEVYLCTNKYGQWGAAAILYGENLRDLAEVCDSDLYVFPVSIHECIVGSTNDISEEFVEEIAGATRMVSRGDMLSNHIYRYRKVTSSLELVPQRQEEVRENSGLGIDIARFS